MSINTRTFTFDHPPTLADIQGKLDELREGGSPKLGVVALNPEDYRALAHEIIGEMLPDFYTINVCSDRPENAVRAVPMSSVKAHWIIFGYLVDTPLYDTDRLPEIRERLERCGFYEKIIDHPRIET